MINNREVTCIPYTPTPTGWLFHQSNEMVRLALGPIGCGKTHMCIYEIFLRASRQPPDRFGVKRSRWAIIRNTYPELKSTTIDAWQHVFKPEIFGTVKRDIPMTHRVKIQADDGLIDLEVIFMSCDNEIDVKKLLSLRITGIFFNELSEIHPKIFEKALERAGRYPDMESGGPLWYGLIADTNPPDKDHWIYRLFEIEKPEGYEIFKYPPGLLKVDGKYITNPNAENLKNLVQNYYLNLVPGKSEEEIKVQLMGQYGYIQSGRAVHPEFNDKLHYSDTVIKYDEKVELALGWDFGLTPACAIVQLIGGRLLVLDELFSESMSLRQFVEHVVLPKLNRDYPGWRGNYVSRHDPADSFGNTGQTNQQILFELGIESYPAASDNSAQRRRDGLTYHLTHLVGGESSFLLSANCIRLRKGLSGGFKYARVKISGEDRYHDRPVKNMYSHICEALEYVAMAYARDSKEMKKEHKEDSVIANILSAHNKVLQARMQAWNIRR